MDHCKPQQGRIETSFCGFLTIISQESREKKCDDKRNFKAPFVKKIRKETRKLRIFRVSHNTCNIYTNKKVIPQARPTVL